MVFELAAPHLPRPHIPHAEGIPDVVWDDYREPTSKEMNAFRDVVGWQMPLFLKKFGAKFFISRDVVRRRVRTTNYFLSSEPKQGPNRYSRTDYAVIMNDRLIDFITWKALDPKEKHGKFCEIGFSWLAEWAEPPGTPPRQYAIPSPSDRGIYTTARTFLKRLGIAVKEIAPDCTVNIHAGDSQRERMYRRALKGQRNFVFFKNDEDIADSVKVGEFDARPSVTPEFARSTLQKLRNGSTGT